MNVRTSAVESDTATLRSRITRTLRAVPDFPTPGILFQDITPVLADSALFAEVVTAMTEPWRGVGVTHVAGVESRGFVLAAPIALGLGCGFIPIRKPGKLPWRCITREYALEYGTGQLQVHADALPAGATVLVVDDVLATGGTARASCDLIEAVGGQVAGCAFLLAISALEGALRLSQRRIETLVAV